MSDLRDRIAKVLWTRFAPQIELGVDGTWEQQHPVAREMWREDADELILALALRQEWTYSFIGTLSGERDYGFICDTRAEAEAEGSDIHTRYVTDWQIDQ